LRDRNLALSSILMVAMASILYASAVVLPQMAQQVLGYTATWSGLILSPGAFLIVLLIPFVSQLQKVLATKYVIMIGFLSLGFAFLYSHGLAPDIDFRTLALMRAAQAAGLAFIFAPLTGIAFSTIDKKDNGDAAALFTMFRNVSGSIGISLSTAMTTERTQIRLAHLGQHVGPLDPGYANLLALTKHALQQQGLAVTQAAGMIYQTFRAQAAILAYMDIFAVCSILAFCVVPVTLLLGSEKAAGGGGH
jgi:DHA2 family multidrug resistance protein